MVAESRLSLAERHADPQERMAVALTLMEEAHFILSDLRYTDREERWISAILGKLASARGGLYRLLHPPMPTTGAESGEGRQ